MINKDNDKEKLYIAMKTLNTITEIRSELTAQKNLGKKIAFVPTMGALHRGHLALVEKARQVADIVVVSVFVNKTQFNDANDYAKYPRQLESDAAQLQKIGVDFLFAPNEKEIYPQDSAIKIHVTKFADCLCGSTRQGHFDGVALIVAKLFNIIEPHFAIFGEKDFQQVLIIKNLVRDLNFNLQIITCDIIREESGLAMSSRNQRLTQDDKVKAANIYKILNEIKSEIKEGKSVDEILAKKTKKFLEIGFEKIDYLEIRDEENLQLVQNVTDTKNMRIFIAIYLNGVRLIDNLKI